MTSQLAQVTPIDRRPLAYTTGPVNAVRVWNPTAYNVRAILGGQLYDIIPAGQDAIYDVANLSGYAGWVLLIPTTPVDGSQLAGQIVVTTYGAADALPSGAISQQNQARYQPDMANPDPILDSLRGALSFNVRMFGARGDGVTDDTAAIQACLDACRVCGGGAVYLPTGTYFLNTTDANPTSGSVTGALWIGASTTLRGDGAGASILKFGAHGNQAWIIGNYNVAGAGTVDEHIRVESLTIDGNAAAQNTGVVDAQHGLIMVFVRDFLARGVTVQNVFGTTGGTNGPNGTDGEGFHFDAKWSTDCVWESCQALGTSAAGGATATGFSANGSTHCTWANCTSWGMGHGNGFTQWQTTESSYTGCHAYLGGSDGFHCEYATHITYAGCVSGGVAENQNNPAGLTNGEHLGNAGEGFQIFQTSFAVASGCQSSYNGANGYHVDNSSDVNITGCQGHANVGRGVSLTNAGTTTVTGGIYTGAQVGIGTDDAASTTALTIDAGVKVDTGNTVWPVIMNGTGTARYGPLSSPPAVPGSTVALANPYPFPVTVYVSGGTVSAIAVTGGATGLTSGAIHLTRDDTLTLTYSGTPALAWFGG